MIFFFFSSRRRHTRCGRDWSSDVCSSDLRFVPGRRRMRHPPVRGQAQRARVPGRPHHALRRRAAGGGGRAARADQPRRRHGRQRDGRRRMRLQLRGALVLASAAAVLLAGPGPVRAEGDASARMTVFRESSKLKGNDGITVFHPQVDASGTLGSSLQVTAGWNADIVSGATPAVYGPVTGPDAISSATRFTDTRNAAHGGFDYMSGTVSLSAAYEYDR